MVILVAGAESLFLWKLVCQGKRELLISKRVIPWMNAEIIFPVFGVNPRSLHLS